MIVLAAMMLAMTVQSAEPAPTDDVVVAAERLKRFRAVTRKDRKTGITHCVIKRRSGDPALDAGVCEALLACAPKVKTEAEIRTCMEPAMKVLVPTLAWQSRRNRKL